MSTNSELHRHFALAEKKVKVNTVFHINGNIPCLQALDCQGLSTFLSRCHCKELFLRIKATALLKIKIILLFFPQEDFLFISGVCVLVFQKKVKDRKEYANISTVILSN